MNFNFSALGVDPARITSTLSLTALCILLLCLIAINISLPAPWIAFLAVLIVLVVALAISSESRKVIEIRTSLVDAPLECVVKSSSLPIYVTDHNLIVTLCNDALCRFLGVQRQEIEKRSINALIKCFARIVPEDRREAFLAEQEQLVKEGVLASPDAEIVEIVDRSLLTGATDKRTFEVWIFAHSVYSLDSNELMGTYVIYHPRPMDALKRPARATAGDQVRRKKEDVQRAQA